MTGDNPINTDDPNEAVDRATRIIAQALARGLMEAEVIIAADREARTQALQPQIVELLTRLVEHTEQLAERMTELAGAVAAVAEARAGQPAAGASRGAVADIERAFAPGGEGIDVTIAAVPGFQGLMELQRSLVRLAQVQSAPVRRYQDDEAAIQLVLAQPMTASAIAEGVTNGTGSRLVVEEARPEALRLRLRFLE